MAKRSRQSLPQRPVSPVVTESDPIQRRFPAFGVHELIERRTALTNSAVIAQQVLEQMSHQPDPKFWGIHPNRLPVFLAHLTLAYDTLKTLAHYYTEDYEIARREETISIVAGPSGLVGADGRPL